MQAPHFAHLAQHGAAHFEAVVDLRRGAHVDERTSDAVVLDLDVDAADLIGGVFFVGHPTGRGTRGAAGAQGVNAGTLGTRAVEGIGVDADEQIGVDPLRFAHTLVQGHKEVAVPRHEGAHGQAIDPGVVDAIAQALGDLEHHVFLIGAARTNGARVFTAMPRVERDHDQPLAH